MTEQNWATAPTNNGATSQMCWVCGMPCPEEYTLLQFPASGSWKVAERGGLVPQLLKLKLYSRDGRYVSYYQSAPSICRQVRDS